MMKQLAILSSLFFLVACDPADHKGEKDTNSENEGDFAELTQKEEAFAELTQTRFEADSRIRKLRTELDDGEWSSPEIEELEQEVRELHSEAWALMDELAGSDDEKKIPICQRIAAKLEGDARKFLENDARGFGEVLSASKMRDLIAGLRDFSEANDGISFFVPVSLILNCLITVLEILIIMCR